MSLFIGLSCIALLIIVPLYFLVLKKFHFTINIFLIFILAIIPLYFVQDLHTVFLMFLILSIGSIFVYLAHIQRVKNNSAKK